MPKQISPVYQSSIVYALYNSFMHTDEGLKEVLYQVLGNIGWTFTISHPCRVCGGWQANITLSSSTALVTIFGETFHMPYKARDSAYIYALDYVDRFIGIDIIDINRSLYVVMINAHDVDDPRL
uniref:Uncharacterized protein n=1 Tax=Setaria viridis TaxID=4556 RepID=A0A4U6T2F6_SETVI|nr:hypothetical protein SEVIR_9G346600v2 [Setaria viridis]